MGTINFGKSDFPSLAFMEFTGEWNPVGMDDLQQGEADFMLKFINYCDPSGELVEPDNLLLVKAGNGGVIKTIYGPTLFRSPEGGLILKTGENIFSVEVNGSTFKVGDLEGELNISGETKSVTIKDEAGEEVAVDIPKTATLSLLPANGEEWEFVCGVRLDAASKPTSAKLKQTLKRGESIAQYISPAPVKGEGGGGSPAVKMKELEIGEYRVIGLQVTQSDQYGEGYILELEDGTRVWSGGNITTALRDETTRLNVEAKLAAGSDVSLALTGKQTRGDRTYVDCALRFRAPRALVGAAPTAKNSNSKPGNSKPKDNPQAVHVGEDIPF